MKVKSVAMMALSAGAGVGAVLAYQKYKKPVKKEMEKVASKAIKKANNKLEDMM